jgi:hypothetical protein
MSKIKQRCACEVADLVIAYGVNLSEQWCWLVVSDPKARPQGPFRTRAEAVRDSELKMLGPQCAITYGGQWDPASNNPQ